MRIKSYHWFLGFIIFVLLVRLILLGLYPLLDTTEARYAEIGRIMFETSDWITPYFDYNIPFWGKPPLSFWLSALSFNIFGVNEFGARFPSWLLGFISLVIFQLASKPLAIKNPLLPAVMLLSSVIFFLTMGAVMTEASLMLGIILSLVSALYVLCSEKPVLSSEKPQKKWALLFFCGLAIGMLAKGPIILVFIGIPLCFWAIVHGQIKVVWANFYWFRGVLLFLLISLPWFILAELKTPGFINYFIIGEHFNRFLVSGWGGDKYGSAHNEVHGTIWLYWLQGTLPWGIIAIGYLIAALIKDFKNKTKQLKLDKTDWLLIYWAMFPQVFFSFAGNILWTYAVLGLPAFILFMVRKMEQVYFSDQNLDKKPDQNKVIAEINLEKNKHYLTLKYVGLLTPIIFTGYVLYLNLYPLQVKSDKLLMENIDISNNDKPIYYLDRIKFSSRFYSSGKAKEIKMKDLDKLSNKLINKQAYLIVPKWIEESSTKKINSIKEKLHLKERVQNKRHILYQVN